VLDDSCPLTLDDDLECDMDVLLPRYEDAAWTWRR
jgi:hypothetical protein